MPDPFGTVDPTILAAVVLAFAAGAVCAAVVSRARASRGRASRETGPSASTVAEDGPDRLAELGEIARIGVIRFDERLRVRSANTRAHELLARHDGSLGGLSPIETLADHRADDLVRKASPSRSSSAELAPHPRTEPTVLARARRVGRETWVVLEDVSELRRLQRIRTEFIDNLSHELRTPLSNVRLLTESLSLAVDEQNVPPSIREGIEKIDTETDSLVQIVEELLDLSRIEQGAVALHLEALDVAALAEAAVGRLRLFAERNGVTVSTQIPANPPQVFGDEDRLAQVLINLLHNAIKFSGGRGTVTVRAERVGDDVRVSVVDEGVGIAKADLERVFERFYKVDRARVRGSGGTGLGLAISRHIVESHRGRIWAESEDGRGTTVSFTLPVAAPV